MDAIQRFTSRVDLYARFRPSYPPDVIELLRRHCGLRPSSLVTDIGSGTGIFSNLLVQTGATVYSVEPNEAMRGVAERDLGSFENFRSIDGTSEKTGLASQSIDIVTAAQAAHWFDQDSTKEEWRRILKPSGWVALLWNTRLQSDPFSRAYEAMIREFTLEREQEPYRRKGKAEVHEFFNPCPVRQFEFPNQQALGLEGLIGRTQSSSYAPEPGHPFYEPMVRSLRDLFEAHQVNGQVWFRYTTEVWLGQLD